MKYYQNSNKSVFKLDFHDNSVFEKLKVKGKFLSSLMELGELPEELFKVVKSRTGYQVFNEKTRTIKQVSFDKLVSVIEGV